MNTVRKIASDERVQLALTSLAREVDKTLNLAIEIQQIPSPTGSEEGIANFLEQKFKALDLSEVHQDTIHNVYGKVTGTGSQPPLVISAHTDTVFPLGTDLSIRYENNHHSGLKFIYGPGLADNALGVAGLIVVADTLSKADFQTESDIWFVGNVGEEGLGNLQGMRALVSRFGDQATYIVLEGGSFGHVFNQAIGVRRFSIRVETGGGHSWGDFGNKSAIHELSKIISLLDAIQLPEDPKTTLNVGVIEGGTTINSIAARASCQVDLRSTAPEVLDHLVDLVTGIVQKVNAGTEVLATMTEIGNRPAGIIPRNSALPRLAKQALQEVGFKEVSFMAGSTDANIPISRGIPAVCIGLANSANTHRLDEFLDPTHLGKGLSQLLLLTLAVAGLEV